VEVKRDLAGCKREYDEVMYKKYWLSTEEEEGLVDAVEGDVSCWSLMTREVEALADGMGQLSVGY